MNDLNKEIEKSRIELKPFVSRGQFNGLPDWGFFLNYLNYSFKYPVMCKKKGDYFFLLEVFDQQVRNTKYAYDHIYQVLNSSHPLGVQKRPCFLVSLLGDIPALGEHEDSCDQMHIACVGESIWKITLNDLSVKEYTLEPGDLIFIPTGLKHVVTCSKPRAGITFSANLL